jgi:ABC-type transporter Mla subunit MlaD
MKEIGFRGKLLSIIGIMLCISSIGYAYYVVYYTAAQSQKCTVLAVFTESVSGLEPGSFVLYLGVPVGKVLSIDLINDRIHIKVAFYHQQVTINQSSYLMLESSGMLERKLLSVYTPNLSDLPLEDSQEIRTRKSANSFQSNYQEITNLLRRGNKLILELEEVLSGLHLPQVTDQLNKALENTNSLIIESRQLLRQVRKTRVARWIGLK